MEGLQRKVGPLKMYQWVGLGVILGLGVLVWRRTHPSSAGTEGEVFGGTGTGAFGPINPETGVPYAFEGGAAGTGTAAGTISEQLGGLGELLGTLRELGLWPEAVPEGMTPAEAAEDEAGAGAKKPHADKARKSKAQKAGAKRATSTGAGAHQGHNSSHTSAPHPKHRIGVSQNHPVSGQHAAIAPGHAVGQTPSHRQPGTPKRGSRAGASQTRPAASRRAARPPARPAPARPAPRRRPDPPPRRRRR